MSMLRFTHYNFIYTASILTSSSDILGSANV
nr:MAG TPA: hypothetical protein [Caudoviricetes sp.]